MRQILNMRDTPDASLLVEPSKYYVSCTFCSKSRYVYIVWWFDSTHVSLDAFTVSKSIVEIKHLWVNDHE